MGYAKTTLTITGLLLALVIVATGPRPAVAGRAPEKIEAYRLQSWTLSAGAHVAAGGDIALQGSLAQSGPAGPAVGETRRHIAGFWAGIRLHDEYASSPSAALFRPDLRQNYPNPFNPITTIAFTVGDAGPVSLTVYDLYGRRVRILVSEIAAPGAYSVDWRGLDDSGRRVASGLYFYALRTGDTELVKKMLLLK